MLKPVFDFTADQCGQPNPLLVLSRNLGQTGSQVTSGTERVSSVQQLVALQKAPSDLLVQEYLANVAQNTGPPSTFDMRQMLAQLPANDQRQIGKVLMEQSWTEAQAGSKTAEIATNWTRNFLVAPQSGLATEWNEEFTKERNGAQMEGAWQAARSGSNSTWAKDFLEHYDLSGAQNSNHQHDWEKEFLEHMNKLGIHQDQQHESPFFDYETAWEAIHSKETQENYVFAQGNPYLHEENPLESAQQSFSQGLLADSILQYEAALQREPNNSEIWYSLGIALAENEQDPHAISALRKTLKLNPHSEKAILALAVSLANESFEHLALHELHKWICIHQARELPADNSQNTSLFHQYMPLDRTEFGKVERQFLESARAVQQVDSELQNALSILYNLGRDYDRAVDCLHAALSLKPEDPVLWNRLGATLANADRTAEASNAYKRSLQISPFYVRARYNLGIACMNLNSYREAAAHFVAALQTQHSPDNSHIWSQLRSSLIRFDNSHLLGHELFDALDRRDLAPILNFLQLQG